MEMCAVYTFLTAVGFLTVEIVRVHNAFLPFIPAEAVTVVCVIRTIINQTENNTVYIITRL